MQQGHSHIEGSGRVNTDYSSPFYLGATVGSNNTAELSAIMEAMLYLLHAKVKPGKVIINYDSKWAAQMTRGHARPKTSQNNDSKRETHFFTTRGYHTESSGSGSKVTPGTRETRRRTS